MSATIITSPIINQSIHEDGGKSEEVDYKLMDECPLSKRIQHRPDGELPGINTRIRYNTQEGTQKLYLSVSFIMVEGVVNGERVRIERPIEFFDNRTITGDGQQWLTATMRCLSMAARGGYIDQALEDLREVTWAKGPVRCGVNEYNKPIYHNSEVDAVAWSIQQILYNRGFLTQSGKQVPVDQLVKRSTPNQQVDHQEDTPSQESEGIGGDTHGIDPTVGQCPTCAGELKLRDGCPTCVEGCGFSKCD